MADSYSRRMIVLEGKAFLPWAIGKVTSFSMGLSFPISPGIEWAVNSKGPSRANILCFGLSAKVILRTTGSEAMSTHDNIWHRQVLCPETADPCSEIPVSSPNPSVLCPDVLFSGWDASAQIGRLFSQCLKGWVQPSLLRLSGHLPSIRIAADP